MGSHIVSMHGKDFNFFLLLIVEVKILIVNGLLIQYTQVLWIKNVLIFVQV